MNQRYLPEEGRVNRQGFWESESHRQCTHCRKVFEKTSHNTMTWCKTCNVRRVKEQTPEVKMYRRAKSRARQRGLEFSLKKTDIVIPATCPILGIPLVTHAGKSGAYADSPSLDRIDNSRGYTKDNVWVISQRANAMKHDAPWDELVKFAEWILNQTGTE
jgi:predicted  nucleic acid-binding Zn-ribbon protein